MAGAKKQNNKLYVTAYLGESDLRSLARSLGNMAGVMETAEGMGLQTELSLEGLDRELTVFVPTDRLAAFLLEVKGAGHWHGTIDAYTQEAVKIAQAALCEQVEDMTGLFEEDLEEEAYVEHTV